MADDDYVRDSKGLVVYVSVGPGSKVPLTKQMQARMAAEAKPRTLPRDSARANGDQSGDGKGRVFVEPYGWVTPVTSRTGSILYYTDSTGARVGDTLAGPGSGYNPVGPYDGAPSKAQAKKAAEDRAARQTTVTQTTAQAAIDAKYNGGYAWVNGQRMKVVGVDQATNTLSITLDDGAAQKYSPPTAYGALEASSEIPSGTTQYLMGIGARMNADGSQAPMSFSDIIHGGVGSNYMTISNGLQWLLNLSLKDEGAYSAMVEKLHNSGYLSDADYKVTGKRYDQNVASAFARAARDTAVINSQGGANGAATTLDAYLDGKAKEIAANGGLDTANKYTAVRRDYTDPTQIKATAKTAAEQALGRDLTPEEEGRLTAHFRGLENAAYDSYDAAGFAGQGGSTTMPSVAGQVDAFVSEGDHEQEAANWRTAGYGDALRGLFGLSG